MAGRCDEHVGVQYPPRCSMCAALVEFPRVPLASVPVPVWAKTIDNEGEAGK